MHSSECLNDVYPYNGRSRPLRSKGPLFVHAFETVLAIVNPAAQNGKAPTYAALLEAAYADGRTPFRSLVVRATQGSGHAREIAAAAASFDTVLVIGGDGIVHETAQGLMATDRAHRPALALLPCGNGNDYARTLGMPMRFDDALGALRAGSRRCVDVGCVNGSIFVQTLSFGFDAAIALGTHARRLRTGHTGTRLFLEEGLNQLLFHRDEYACSIALDGEAPVSSAMFLCAVQVGPTYGGGFAICPRADPFDGSLDYCIARPPVGLLRALSIFLKAKNGNHASCGDVLSFGRAKRLRLSFPLAPPAQIDGEELLCADAYDISVLPGELDVIFAPGERRRL